jgi:2-oxoglutarate/2-oxoacid ferredoxin oxidoreductase subunit beta
LVSAIKKSLSTPGFTFIEVLSPCPTQFGRRNRYDSPADMMKILMERCISREEAGNLSEDELKDRIVTGEFRIE